jgi:enoyl-CoA hydratase/carnithine racemase
LAAFNVTESESCLWLEFNVPDSANAFSLEAARELAGIQKRFKKWRAPVVVSSANPRVFCSGGNLSDYQKLKGKSAGLKVNREITRHLDAFGAWPAPKLALIEGDVMGGGVEWLARFDFRWSVPHALWSFWQRRIGLSTGWGGGRAWARRIGEERVRALLIEGRLLSAYEAERLGLADRIVNATRARAFAAEWVVRLAALPGQDVAGWSVAGESRLFESLWLGPEHRKVLAKWK